MKLLSALSLLAAPLLSWALVIPGADTPLFYLVASSPESSTPYPVRIAPDGLYTTLSGSGTAIQAYMWRGALTGTLDRSASTTYRPFLSTTFDSNGPSCTTSGQLGYSAQGYSTNKCHSWPAFQIGVGESGQLGSKLNNNYGPGGFYSCGPDEMIWFKVNPQDEPQGCVPVDLYTVPVL